MDKIVIRLNVGCQPYLRDCYMLADGFAPIKIIEEGSFSDVICSLLFLIDPQNTDYMEDTEFAQHLLEIAKNPNYSFIFNVWDAKEYLECIKQEFTNSPL